MKEDECAARGGTWQSTGGDYGRCRWTETFPVEERATYPNDAYVMRWYLTKIKSSNYREVAGARKGDWIDVQYEHGGSALRMEDLYHPQLVSSNRAEWPLVGVSKSKGETEDDNHITAIYAADDYSFVPVYPVSITTPFEKVEFEKSAGMDVNMTGDQKLDAIVHKVRVGNSYELSKKILFVYDSHGHAVGHPYSKASGTGLLKLNELKIVDRDGNSLPYAKFFYASNPAFPGRLSHDFFGYYSSRPTGQLKNPFVSNEGHSTLDAAAWSLCRIVRGAGSVVEYEYEPNEVTAFTTNEDIPLLHGPGVRVRKETVHDGVGAKMSIEYRYGKGYTAYNMALASYLETPAPENYLGEIYLLLNYGELWANAGNVLLLTGNGVSYESCGLYRTGRGIERHYFLSPADHLREAGGERSIPLADREYGKSSMAAFRGAPKRVEYYREGNADQPVSAQTVPYEIKHDKFVYITPPIRIEPDLTVCQDYATGIGGTLGDPPSFPDADIRYLEDTIFIGSVRPITNNQTVDGVNSSVAYYYDPVSQLVKSTKKCDSDHSCIETEKVFAHEIGDYSWLTTKNMLTSLAGRKIWGSALGRNGGALEVISASSSTWNENEGGYSDNTYAWNVNMDAEGFPATGFSSFNYGSRTGTHWQRTGAITKVDDYQRVLEAEGAANDEFSSTIYRPDVGLAMAKIRNGRYADCAVFTCDYDMGDPAHPGYYDYSNGWEKGLMTGDGHISEVTPAAKHFGLRCVHVSNTYGPTRNVPLDLTKKYHFSAWIRPVSSASTFVRFGFEYRNQDDAYVGGKNLTKTDLVPGQWQLIEYAIDLDDVPAGIDGVGDYIRIWVGNGPGDPASDFYVDDIRFHPATALVTTLYYDPYVGKLMSMADEGSKVAEISEFDGFGRLVSASALNEDGSPVTVTEKEYSVANDLDGNEIRLLYPTGGEKWRKGLPARITWIAGPDITAVNVWVSTNGGSSYGKISSDPVTRESNDWGAFNWTVAMGPSSTCKVMVTNMGGTVESKSHNTFTIVDPDPGTPSNPSPSNGATNQDYGITLSWAGTGSGTVKYDIYFAGQTPPQQRIATDLTTTSFALPNDLISNNTYYWRVVAKNANGVTEGPVWSFATSEGTFPYAVLSKPAYNTRCGLKPSGVKLAWDGDADSWDIYYWKDGDTEPTAPQHTTSAKNLIIADLTNKKWYNWKVRATRPSYLSQFSSTWRFRVFEKAGATAPSAVSNLRGSRGSGGINLQWDGGNDPDGDLVFYKVFLYVERPQWYGTSQRSYRDNVTKDSECDCHGECDWANLYQHKLETEYDFGWGPGAPGMEGVRWKNGKSCYLIVERFSRALTLPGVSEYDKVHFYVQTVNLCNTKLKSSTSALKTIDNAK